ncbi:diguanylate cyclase (GGDEF) domain-containing protein [Clostridium cavendishii DSM 21758]|uniref:Diguanylate cyclase (GGDEF) domain-containing protein n=1 Tax=Clostridium cavendishii DSM 21758 TaxID=1121302 RepID=A0A1M6UGR5_9CLOT|nr:GGDEF domain-containing protein [Clostridium cavendishii]SHK68377.1 diguanylate cyclase (GGDEF) domain-containing protein [Clostridium cavendishii DSM 21758]
MFNKKYKVRTLVLIAIIVMIFILAVYILFNNMEKQKVNHEIEVQKTILDDTLKFLNITEKRAVKGVDKEIEELKEQYKSNNDLIKQGNELQALAFCYNIKGDNNEADKYYDMAEEKYKSDKYGKAPLCNLYMERSEYYLDIKNYSEGLKYSYKFIEMIKMDRVRLKEIFNYNESDIKLNIYANFIQIYAENSIEDKAKKYFNEIEKFDEEKLNKDMKIKVLYSKLIYYEMIKDKEKLEEYSNKVYESYKSYDKENGTDISDGMAINLAISNLESNKLDKVLSYLKQAEDFFNRVGDNRNILYVYRYYGDYYVKIKDFKNAKIYYDKALDGFKANNNCVDAAKQAKDILAIKYEFKDFDYKKYYDDYLENSEKRFSEDTIRNLISSIVDINNTVNEEKLEALQREKDAILVKNNFKNSLLVVLILSTVIMTIMVKRLFLEIKRRKLSEEKLKKLANLDYLTKCCTKSFGYGKLKKLIDNKEEFQMAMIDIDDFKNINDKFGHIIGDTVLKQISKILIENITNDDFIIRFGGEEFIIVFREKTYINSLEIINNIRYEIERKTFKYMPNKELKISISGGFKSYDGSEIDVFIEKVDKLLYKAKSNGKNKIEI